MLVSVWAIVLSFCRRNVTMATFEEPNETFMPSPQRQLRNMRPLHGHIAGRMQDGRLEGIHHY